MREPQTREIQGRTYSVVPLPTGKGLAVMTRLGKVAGPSLGLLPSLKSNADVLGEIGKVLERLEGNDLEWITRELALDAQVSNAHGVVPLQPIYDVHFAGDYFALFGFARFAIEVNFGPLFSGLKGLGVSLGVLARAQG